MSGAVGCFAGFRIAPIDRSYRVGMELIGSRFAFDVPAGWAREAREADDEVRAASNEVLAGFPPNVVLRESRLTRPAPTSLAAASQANLAVLSTQIPGSFFSSTWRRSPTPMPRRGRRNAVGCGRSRR